MATLELLSNETLRLITDGLSPCSLSLLMLTTPSMKHRMLSGGVRKLTFDALEEGRVVTFGGVSNSCSTGKCCCLLRWLKDFSHVREIMISDERLTKSLGAPVAPYRGGLPSGCVHLTIVLRQTFLRWIHKGYRGDYALSEAVPNLQTLTIGEVSSLDDRTYSALKLDVTIGAAPFAQFLSNLPKQLEHLSLPPITHAILPKMFPDSLTRTSMMLRWKQDFDSMTLPSHLISLQIQIKDYAAFGTHVARVFPKTLTDLTVFYKIGVNTNLDDIPKPTWIKQIPPVSSLKLHNIDHVRFADLPPVLTHLTFTAWWPVTGIFDTTGWAPEYLTYLEINRWEPVSQLGSLPKCIENLVINSSKPSRISKLPDSLTKFSAPAYSTFINPNWPLRLHTLEIHHLTTVTSDTMASFPKTITKLSMSIPNNTLYEGFFSDLPPSIKHLSLWNRKADHLIFKALRNSHLEVLELFAGDSAQDFLPIDIPKFKWSLLDQLPNTLKRLRLPVALEKFEPTNNLSNLSDLSIPNATISFEALQMSLVYYPNIRRILAKEYKVSQQELEDANKLLGSQPLLTLRSVLSPGPTMV